MNPTTPANPGSAMSQGGTFIRPGAVGWGLGDKLSPDADRTGQNSPAVIELALDAAVKDPDRVTELLDDLSRGRLWLPLPEDRPVTDGSAVLLPTVTYLGAEFVPAFTSAHRLAGWTGHSHSPGFARSNGGSDSIRSRPGDIPFAAMPHIVVSAADLAQRLPSGVGIALNPGAEASVPIYPEGVAYMAANPIAMVVTDGAQVRMGRPPADPVTLLAEVRAVLGSIPDVSEASRAWLSVPGQGEGLVISVTLHDPSASSVRQDVLSAIEQAARTVPDQGFPIDVTFPGEGEPDQVDHWISAHAEPFYLRSNAT
jgi:SseB protein C-terminal domain/SseB protein N-terminal domain